MSFRRYFDHLLLAAIVGACGLTVSYISKMSENIQNMTVAVQILSEKNTTLQTTTDKINTDHERRLRFLERNKPPRKYHD